MIASIFHAAIENKDKSFQEFIEILNALVPEMFQPIVDNYGFDAKAVIMYIMYAYSKESTLLVLGASYARQRRQIAEFVGIPDSVLSDVVTLSRWEMRLAISSYLDYQGDRDWKHLQQNIEIYEVLCDASIGKIKKDDGSIDFKEINTSAAHKKELLKLIKDSEEKFKNEFKFIIDNKEELAAIDKEKGGVGIGLESSQYVK